MNEPSFLDDPVVDAPVPAMAADPAHAPTVFNRGPAPRPASLALRAAAVVAFLVFATLRLFVALGNGLSPFALAWELGLLAFWPLVAVAVAAVWEGNRTEHRLVQVFLAASIACAAVSAVSFFSTRGPILMRAFGQASGMKPNELREAARKCMQVRDFACAESNWQEYVQLRPGDGFALANLGIVMNVRDEHEQAVVQFQKAVDAGEGTYDLFAYYADSLAKLDRVDEAIDWSYRSLSVVPTLVDVRGSLATLLVRRHRTHEALALLQAFDADAEAHGHPARFTGQRIAIEKGLQDHGPAEQPATAAPLRLPVYAGHYFAPVQLGSSRPVGFMVDTGATRTTVGRALLEASKANYRVLDGNVQMTTADGRQVRAEAIVIETLQVGPFTLQQVHAVVCDACVTLLGQSTLSRFDLQSSRQQGVEFLTLSPRPGALSAASP